MFYTRKCGEIEPSDFGSEQTLCGWLQDTRNLGGIAFIQLRDISGVIQLTLLKKKLDEKQFKNWTNINRESVVLVRGIVKENKEAPGGVEMLPDNIELLNEAETPLPLGVIDKIDSEIETRLNARYMDLRKKDIAAHFQIRAAVSGSVHKHLRREKFLEVQTPKIIASATEGGTSLFEMKYFDRTAYLAQSPQLYKQILMGGGLERVYEVGPAFRAEEHNTPRHLNEFISIDIEMSFADDDVVMGVMERLVDSASRAVAKEAEALEILDIKPIELELPLPRITYDDAVEMAKGKAKWGEDLSMEATRAIAEQMNGFYFITKWPLSLKPFYIQPDDDPKYSKGFDFMYNEIEMTSGGQRVHDVNLLRERLKEQELDPEGFNHYLDPFRYGMPPHAGWGLGLDRLAMIFTGAKNVRECVLFPRDRTRMTP
ncbi:MAG: aspartate--tRNA(Asn) ligase [Candidatus Poseidoniia archaeon]|jgi:aspartyl-tRNA synthetase|nr:aspartate--tRNA(Asn) ligase [Euryarchaeota archaeon]MDP6440988.1 aspartate--tRNA(Asn) ligase [Candidatus Poseidoniia archaeon]MDP6591492.1 aspartate--tRNA(Asn) ligase [Candidatus Poseidoniia archaeon]MDP7095934.1 aspartate--tRNA(Asn) ligase [Candidatus Poseidoniia archaeon]MDP7444121.1 aspartate--tRNA(Asn) ligase [Candidatus Poseidoniia archaeon]|tara:strand:+ start:3014 stop:4297 length:1284 start_codon:yes stop_codon:yes gene_type:complete